MGRVMRKSSCSDRPPRKWEGLHFAIDLDTWDVAAHEPTHSKDVDSFRTPVHKAVFKARGEAFSAFQRLYVEKADACSARLVSVRREEKKGWLYWDHMITQL